MESLDSPETRLKCKEFSIVCRVFAYMSVRLCVCTSVRRTVRLESLFCIFDSK